MMERIFDLFISIIVLFIFHWVYNNVAFYQIPLNVGTWIIALFVFDFIAYWFHRLSHEINFLWAAHIVHHQSEELNFTTVFRVSFFAVIFRFSFFVWMAVIGFDALTIASCSVFLGFYQLLTHSRAIGKLGVIEYFFTTPSHHRVHHGINEQYMDHNYGHIFIIWDKLFGTFIEEKEEPIYGITSGFESADPYKANFSYWRNLFYRAKKTKYFKDKIKIFFKGPAWTPDDVLHLPNEYKTDESGKRLIHRIQVEPHLGLYIAINCLFTFICFMFLLFQKTELNKESSILDLFLNMKIVSLSIFILFSVFVYARLIEQSKNALILEILRLISMSFLLIILLDNIKNQFLLWGIVVLCFFVMIFWLTKFKSKLN